MYKCTDTNTFTMHIQSKNLSVHISVPNLNKNDFIKKKKTHAMRHRIFALEEGVMSLLIKILEEFSAQPRNNVLPRG